MGLLIGIGRSNPESPYNMWYGVEGDYSSLDYKLKRVGNLDLHRSLPIQSRLRRFVENADGSVKYYLHGNDSRKREDGSPATIDSTDGNVMLEIPEYYMKFEVSGTKWLFAISEYPLPGFIKQERKTISPWYATIDSQTNTVVSGCFLTWRGNSIARNEQGLIIYTQGAERYRGGGGLSDAGLDNTPKSQVGVARTGVSRDNVRAACKLGTHHGSYRAYNQIAWLQRIEYASLHCQDEFQPNLALGGFKSGGLGIGCAVPQPELASWNGYRPFVPSGVTATLGNQTGRVVYSIKGWNNTPEKIIQVTSYRGLETPFEYLWLQADDLFVLNMLTGEVKESFAYVCSKPSGFSTPESTPANSDAPAGYERIASLPTESGYVKAVSVSSQGYGFPMSLGGSSVTGSCDGVSAPSSFSSMWVHGLLGGPAHDGGKCGFGCIATYREVNISYEDYAFRLCRG
ncbi:hypothetical protein HMPREF1988_00201 [Porphyromonas gingivalis F0185]|uniref:hypothetical protein n=1 Tax=Porphyromonas gingivalis TaxID=837 RepID=UPI0003ACFA22|nr:hypothetical protein [Porphyromonas gingivalis]ERJ86142.1 hypothetical protein HMPREF1988_00201 [Porphyromonas gingivalis F0185]